MTCTPAEDRAALAEIFDRPGHRDPDPADPSTWPPVALVRHDKVPPGHSAWRVGRSLIVMPTLLPSAPPSMTRRLIARVLTDALGRCPSAELWPT